MITITDGKETFTIKRKELWERKEYFKGLATKLKYDYWAIELLFIRKDKEKNKFDKIVKCFPSGDDFLQEFINLDSSKSNYVLLSESDYKEVKLIYDNMKGKTDYKKEAIIEAVAMMFSFECYQNYVLERDLYVKSENIFKDFVEIGYDYTIYKKEIYKRAKEILKDKYKVDIAL